MVGVPGGDYGDNSDYWCLGGEHDFLLVIMVINDYCQDTMMSGLIKKK